MSTLTNLEVYQFALNLIDSTTRSVYVGPILN